MGLLRLLLVGFFSLITNPSQAANDDFAYKGLPLGSTINAFKKSNAEFDCGKLANRMLYCLSEKSTYFGIRANRIYALFIDGKMSNVHVDFRFAKSESARYELRAKTNYIAHKKALIEKYGNPIKADDTSKNFFEGGWLANWDKKDSTLSLLVPSTDELNAKEITMEVEMELKNYSSISGEILNKKQKKDI